MCKKSIKVTAILGVAALAAAACYMVCRVINETQSLDFDFGDMPPAGKYPMSHGGQSDDNDES